MRKFEEGSHIAPIIYQWLKGSRPGQIIMSEMARRAWTSCLGPMVDARTSRLELKNKILYVELNSTILRQELLGMKNSILEALIEKLGKNAVVDIVFL